MERYDPHAIEREVAAGLGRGRRLRHARTRTTRPRRDARKAYVLEMLPYPSGELHMGHVLNYTLGDVVSHVRRRSGYSVLRPMGYDAFGLPAENAAIREGGHPREVTERNIAAIRAQIKRMGWSIDWTREVSTHEPEYYRWTQWLFLQLLRGRARLPQGGAGQVVPERPDRARERAGDRRPLRALRRRGRGAQPRAVDLQDHRLRRPAARRHGAARLARARPDDAAQLDRPLRGRRGPVPDRGARRGRPRLHDAARHALRRDVLRARARASAGRAVRRALAETATSCATYARHAAAEKSEERAAREEKTGVFTGFYAINPVNDARIPIWVADYVLMDYGTGAIMAVPAHDERDFEFAERFDLPIVQVVAPADGEVEEGAAYVAHSEDEVLVNSGAVHAACPSPEAKQAIVDVARRARPRPRRRSTTGCATGCSRGSATGAARSRSSTATSAASCRCRTTELPVLLPEIDDYLPKGRSPLAAAEDWVHVDVPVVRRAGAARDRHDGHVRRLVLVLPALHRPAQRRRRRSTRELVDYWLPVNQYIGGIEHAILHLMYARFFTKALNDLGIARLPRAVRAAVQPGDDLPLRREDVEVEGERRRARRAGRALRRRRAAALHPVHGAGRPGQGVAGHGRRGHGALPAAAVARRRTR